MSDAPKQTVTIKKYANRRLYNTATSSYVTLEDLSALTKEDIEFNVYDAKTGEDITRAVLTQIIVEEESKSGQNLLPISFMRQLISFYGDNMQWLVPKYLEQSMGSLAKNQEQIRATFQTAFGNMFPFGTAFEEMGKQNMAVFERAMRVFTPFGATPSAESPSTVAPASASVAPSSSPKAPSSEKSAPLSSVIATPPSSSPAHSKSVSSSISPSANASSALASVTQDDDSESDDDAMAENAFTPSSNIRPMPIAATAQAAAKAAPLSGEDVQQKIAALQRQLADLARNKA